MDTQRTDAETARDLRAENAELRAENLFLRGNLLVAERERKAAEASRNHALRTIDEVRAAVNTPPGANLVTHARSLSVRPPHAADPWCPCAPCCTAFESPSSSARKTGTEG